MSKHRDYVDNDILAAGFLDALNEFLGSAASNLVISKASSTSLQVVAGAGNAQVAVAVAGAWRFISTTINAGAPANAAGTYPIYVVSPVNSTTQEDAGTFNYSFALKLATAPTGTGAEALSRQIGTYAWDGAAITGLTQTVGVPAPTPSATLSRSVLEVGMVNQTRAGRQLALADFTTLLGIGAPTALWNLSDLTDASGNARTLSNRGSPATTFGAGITGAATEAAIFRGPDVSTTPTPALYIADSGTADPFRLKTGSWWCWFRTAKAATQQSLMSKVGSTATAFDMRITTGNVAEIAVNLSGTAGGALTSAQGATNVCDDRWHFVLATFDGGDLRLYVDGELEATTIATAASNTIFAAAFPLNIGASRGDAATTPVNPFYGRIDEAGITADVLSPDQARLLMCVKLPHGLDVAPRQSVLAVTRRRRGALLATGDFPSQPARLYNLTNLTDLGANNAVLTPSTSAIVQASGPDGIAGSARAYGASGTHAGDSATDAGLPSGTSARSYGLWFKTATDVAGTIMGWGLETPTPGDTYLTVTTNGLTAVSGTNNLLGPFVSDGAWHFAVVVEDNAALDRLTRKLYLDGGVMGSSTLMNSAILGGAGRFRIGAHPNGNAPFTGLCARAFVFAGALTTTQIRTLYVKGAQALGVSPKAVGDHVEAWDATNVYAVFDTLGAQDSIDLGVTA